MNYRDLFKTKLPHKTRDLASRKKLCFSHKFSRVTSRKAAISYRGVQPLPGHSVRKSQRESLAWFKRRLEMCFSIKHLFVRAIKRSRGWVGASADATRVLASFCSHQTKRPLVQ